MVENSEAGIDRSQRLYPRASETRQVVELSGVWKFKLGNTDPELDERPARRALETRERMPVPASYNDISQNPQVRDHIGWVWYEREFFADTAWRSRSVYLRIGSASQNAKVWLNGVYICENRGGYLPFGGMIESMLSFDGPNRLTIAVGNILDWTTLPPGELISWEGEEPLRSPKGRGWEGH
ncbi:MAG: sugar-binding domain-containing protein, partial [Verrucomicrobiota bacterium]